MSLVSIIRKERFFVSTILHSIIVCNNVKVNECCLNELFDTWSLRILCEILMHSKNWMIVCFCRLNNLIYIEFHANLYEHKRGEHSRLHSTFIVYSPDLTLLATVAEQVIAKITQYHFHMWIRLHGGRNITWVNSIFLWLIWLVSRTITYSRE
jgi:hypothetical protein